MKNYFIKILPLIILMVAFGFAGYSVGKREGVKQGASVLVGVGTNQNNWWPAGGGMCWHKQEPWGTVLGKISGTKCISLTPYESDLFDNLTKSGGAQLLIKTTPALQPQIK